MPLTAVKIKAAKPKEKQYKLTDGGGLYLLVSPTGAKYWRINYRYAGKYRTHAVGVFPEVSLAEAREQLFNLRQLLKNGVDPAVRKRSGGSIDNANNFEMIARQWWEKNKDKWSEKYAANQMRQMERNLFPWLGEKDINEITSVVLLDTLQRVENRGATYLAHRMKQVAGQIFRYAIITGRAENDPSVNLKGALKPHVAKHMATVTDLEEVRQLLKSIDTYHGGIVVQTALKLAPLTFVRPGELRHAEWKEINEKDALWKIPAPKMKKRRPHIIPLSRQALKVLEEIKPFTGDGKYIFPSPRTKSRAMSENAVLAALRSLGYDRSQMTGHGFRSMASTLLHEKGWPPHVIERQLAHVQRNTVAAAYNHAEYLKDRVKMMQWWADFLDELKK